MTSMSPEPRHTAVHPITVKQAADHLGVSTTSAYKLTQSGELPSARLRGRIFTTIEDVHEYIGTTVVAIPEMSAGAWVLVEPPDREAVVLVRDPVTDAGSALEPCGTIAAEPQLLAPRRRTDQPYTRHDAPGPETRGIVMFRGVRPCSMSELRGMRSARSSK